MATTTVAPQLPRSRQGPSRARLPAGVELPGDRSPTFAADRNFPCKDWLAAFQFWDRGELDVPRELIPT